MRFSHDRRGQSVVVGVVILFGFLIVAMAVYQAQVVPQENANVEFEHSQQVENDIGDLRNAILRAGSTGSAQPARVRLGTRYPQRTFFVNPAPVTGEIRTTEQRQLRIENVDIGDGVHENVEEFWATDPEFKTRSVQYTPNYNEYREGPTLTYEHSLVVAEFPNDATLLRTNQTIHRSDRISLTVLSGEVSENGVEARSVDPEAVSQGTRTVPIVANTDSEIVLPTVVGNEVELANRTTERYPNIDATADRGSGEIRLQLEENEEFRLRLSEVSVDGEGETEPAYIVPVGSENVMDDVDASVEVRDRYHNPVEGASVDVFTSTSSNSPTRTLETDDDGRVHSETGTVFTINDAEADDSGFERVVFTRIMAGGGEGDAVRGPDVYDENVDSSEVGVGESFELSATVDSVAPVSDDIYRSGTPIQSVEVVAEDGETTENENFTYDPDQTDRREDITEMISTAGWSNGEYDLTIRGQDASGRWTDDSEAGEAQVTVTEPDEPVPPAGSISGTVTDADTDTGIDGATVTVYDGDSTDAGDAVTSTTTAGDGTYSVEVDPGEYTVEADADGYNGDTEFPVDVGDGEDETVDFMLDPEEETPTFETLTADASEGGNQITEVDFDGTIDNVDEDGQIRFELDGNDGTSQTDEISMTENVDFTMGPYSGGQRVNNPADVTITLLDSDGNVYETVSGTFDEPDDTLSLDNGLTRE
ncbi:hypothetical protein JCM18237_22150 [Halorubrum luteum]